MDVLIAEIARKRKSLQDNELMVVLLICFDDSDQRKEVF